MKVPESSPGRTVLESLCPLKGEQFDEAYIAKVGLQGRKEALAAFQREAALLQKSTVQAGIHPRS